MTTTTTDNPFLTKRDIDLIESGLAKVDGLYILDITAEVPYREDLSEDEAEELQDRADELNSAIEDAERVREELLEAYEELMNLIG
jgi:tRNA A-37 threonylcarbamoyl transferase component Bud32